MGEMLRLHGLGAVVEVRCHGEAEAELVTAMRLSWSRCLSPPVLVTPTTQAETLDVRLDDVAELKRRMMVTTQKITRAFIKSQAGKLLMFHAGAVSDPETGRSLVYVAPGGTGKTTLSRLLAQRLGYLTDETVGIDETGRILPYPKPLSIRRIDQPSIKDEVSPDQLGLRVSPLDPVATQLVLLGRDPDARRVDLVQVDFMAALFGLVEQSSSLSQLPRPLLALADLIDSTRPVLRVCYGESADAAEAMIGLIGVRA